MRQTSGLVFALMCVTICLHVALSAPIVVKRQVDFSDLSEQERSWETQFQDENIPVESGEREKRKIPFELKNAVLGLIFGKINSFIDTKTQLLNTLDSTNIEKNKQLGIVAPSNGNGLSAITGAIGSFKKPLFGGGAPAAPPVSTTPRITTTDDTPVFDRKRVSLVIPDELFGSSFQLVTNVSKIVGDVIMGTAQRTQRLLEAMRPFAGKVLTFKGVNVQTPPGGSSSNKIR